MTTSRFPEITDELLSAYIDNAVTPGERALVEQAASEDGVVAWRLATLRETVALLRALPVLNAPRAFVLTPEMVGQSRAEPGAGVAQNERPVQHPARQPAPQPGRWERLVAGWRELWSGGSPMWRNALATSMAALLVLLVLPALLSNNTRNDFVAAPMMSQVSQESAAAPASEDVVETATDAEHVENATSTAGKLAGAATAIAETDNPQDAEAVALAPATAASGAAAQAPLARSVEAEAVAAPTEVAIVAASASITARTIPSARVTEDAVSGIASAEDAPAYAAAASAPFAPELAAQDTANANANANANAPEGVMLAAPLADEAPAGADAGEAAPASLQTLTAAETPALLASTEAAAPTVTAMPTATVAPTAAAVAEARPEARIVATAPVAVAASPTNPSASPRALGQVLSWLQLAALAGVVAFGFLWWRSRRA